MRLIAWSVLVSVYLATSLPAGAAEDFTGFYAGVNAGYAYGGASDSRTLPAPADASRSPDEGGLPPSAMSAADRLQATHSVRPKTGAR